ncbi:MAG: PAS domain S-box protein [Sideroxydans sp.]|jgi:diguanylate cyclase (GGDEF)-like protein/PAS domain S-box-containing protein
MNARLIPYLQRLKAWQLTLPIVIFSVVLTEVSVALLNLFVRGFIPDGAMLIGFLAGLLVAGILAPITVLLLKELSKQQVQHLEASEQKTRLNLEVAIEAAQMILWELEVGTGILRFDDSKLHWLKANLEGDVHTIDSWLSHVHPDDQAGFMQRFQHVMVTADAKFDYEYRIQAGNDEWVWVQTKGQVSQRNAAGEPLLAAGGTFNIQSRKLAEDQLSQNESLLRTTLESTDEGILMVGADGHVLSANHRFYELWHIPDEIAAVGRDDLLLDHVLGQLTNPNEFLDQVKRLYGTDAEARDLLHFKDGRVFARFTKALWISEERGRIWCFKDITEQYCAEADLRTIKERYDFATQVGKVGTWDWSPITGLLFWSDVTFRLMGFEPGAVTPTYGMYLDLVHPDDRERLNSDVQAALQKKKPYALDCRIILGNGEEIVCHVTGKVEFDADEQPVRMLGTIQDVTERKHMEEEVRQSDQRFRTLFDSSPDPIWIIDGHRFVECNQAAVKMLGYPDKSVLRNTHPSELSPEFQPDGEPSFSKAESMMNLAQERGLNRFEWLHKRMDGSVFYAEVTLSSITLQNHPAIYCVWRDITERKQAEDALAESRNLLKTIIDTSPMRVFWKDRDLHYLGCNPAFAKDAGRASPEEMIGKDDFQMTWGAQAELYRADDRQVMESGIAKLSYDEPQTTPDGETIWLRTSKVPLRNHADEIIGILGIYEDITERKVAEEAVKTSEQKLLTILDNVDAYIYLKDIDGKYLFANRPVRELWQATMEDIVGFGDEKFFDEATTQNIRLNDRNVLDRGEALTSEESNTVVATGKTFTYLSTKLPLRREDGSIYALCGVSTDITARIRSEEALQASEERARTLSTLLRLITDNVTDMIWAKDLNKRYLFANKALCNKLLNAQNTDEPIGKDDMFFAERERNSHPDDPNWHSFGEQCQDSDIITLERGIPSRFDEYGNVKGKFLFLDVHKAPFINDKGEVIGVVGSGRDVTQQKVTEEKLRLASMVLENSSEAMFITDEHYLILEVNPAFTLLTGYSAQDVIGKNPKLLRSGKHEAAFYAAMQKELRKTGHWQGEIWNRRKNGEIFAEWQTINTVYNDDGSVHRHIALFSDITEKKKSEELIWAQANFDQLTGLPNRRMFRDRLAQDIKKAHRAGLGLALMFLDLDRFKEVNDSLGHDMGDALLMEAAYRISACVRESDTVARVGGDEFTIILAELEDRASVERIASNILQSLSRPFDLGKDVAYVSASIGITMYPDDATNLEDMLKNADQAMYVAKNAGRNRFSYFTNAMQERALYRLHMLNDLRSALAEQQFELHYQPIVDIHTGRIHKAEALLRWFHPKRGLISPGEFIPLAEESGLIHTIGDWVFEQAVAQALAWSARYDSDFQISVNKSPLQIQSKSDHCKWKEHLAHTGLPGKHLVIEITEGVLLDHTPIVISELLAFRDAGIQVAIDDFGTGYSALSYLKKLDIDYVKIDQSFILNLESDNNDKALAEAIVVMAHKLGLKVIAEGVETQEQLDLLAKMGCDYAQGFLYSRAVTPEEFEKLLEKIN